MVVRNRVRLIKSVGVYRAGPWITVAKLELIHISANPFADSGERIAYVCFKPDTGASLLFIGRVLAFR